MHRNKQLIIKFLTPALIMFVLVFIYPLLRTLVMSFFQVENITSSAGTWHFTGIENYRRLLSTKLFHSALINLFKIWFFGGVIVMTLALLFAVILNSGIKGKNFYRNMIYMPYTISAVAMASMWLQYVYNTKYGLLTTMFSKLGMEKLAAIAWTDPTHKFWAMFIAYCFGMVGYHMVIFSRRGQEILSYHMASSPRSSENESDHVVHHIGRLLRLGPDVHIGAGGDVYHHPRCLPVYPDLWRRQRRDRP